MHFSPFVFWVQELWEIIKWNLPVFYHYVFALCTAEHLCVPEHPVICRKCSTTCCITGAKKRLFGSTKGHKLLPKQSRTSNVKPTVAGKEYLYWKRSFQSVIYWADDTNKTAVLNSMRWITTAKYNFNWIGLLWLKGDSVPTCWGSGCSCWKPWEIPCPTSPLLLPKSPYSPCTRLLFFVLPA